jgi:hypothetical protein
MSYKVIKTTGITTGTVTLPKSPLDFDFEYDVQVEHVASDGNGETLISRYLIARKIVWAGDIWVKGASNSTILSSYLVPLASFLGGSVTLSDPDSQFGGTWLCGNMHFHRTAEGGETRYTFTLEFQQGIGLVVM